MGCVAGKKDQNKSNKHFLEKHGLLTVQEVMKLQSLKGLITVLQHFKFNIDLSLLWL
jgi:hypothetical protein